MSGCSRPALSRAASMDASTSGSVATGGISASCVHRHSPRVANESTMWSGATVRSGRQRLGGVSLDIDHVTKRFGSTTALDGLTFAVGRGEVFGFLGANGAGKTTTMRAAATRRDHLARA